MLLLGEAALAQAVASPDTPGPGTASAQGSPEGPLTGGAVRGSVTDAQGTPIAGATITLTYGSGTVSLETRSTMDGSFVFAAVPLGASTLSIAFQGFDTVTLPLTVKTAQDATLSTAVLRVSEVKINVDAVVPTHELAAEQLHVEEQQRLIGFVPNFFVTYDWHAAPLSTGQKFTLAWKNASDPGNLLLVGALSGVQQATDEFNGYRQGAAGYGKRYGANLGNLVAGTFMGGAVLPSLFHQDPRYFYKGSGTVKARLWYAITSALVCRGDNGHRQFAWAGVLGDLSAGAISNAYYAPQDRQGAALTFENGFLGVAGDAMNGVVQEFFLKHFSGKTKQP